MRETEDAGTGIDPERKIDETRGDEEGGGEDAGPLEIELWVEGGEGDGEEGGGEEVPERQGEGEFGDHEEVIVAAGGEAERVVVIEEGEGEEDDREVGEEKSEAEHRGGRARGMGRRRRRIHELGCGPSKSGGMMTRTGRQRL